VVRPVAVGVEPRPEDLALVPQIVATGDSLMQGLDDLLEDELDPRAHVSGDVHIGTGLTSDIVGDWDDIPGEQIKAFHPDATVVFLGANDSYAMTPPGGGGKPISCCEQPWIDEYARRARKAMRTYTRADPDAQVFWLTVPSARDFRRNVAAAAVNAGIYQAAGGVPRVHVLDMVTLLTPNGEYRETMPYRGREVRVRQGDGIHLSVAGQRIAGEFVIRAMERRGVF
jgi:hypothetical protein